MANSYQLKVEAVLYGKKTVLVYKNLPPRFLNSRGRFLWNIPSLGKENPEQSIYPKQIVYDSLLLQI